MPHEYNKKTEYHKILSIFYRDPKTKYKNFIMGKYSTPELELLKDIQWQFTEKVDGTNMRVMWIPDNEISITWYTTVRECCEPCKGSGWHRSPCKVCHNKPEYVLLCESCKGHGEIPQWCNECGGKGSVDTRVTELQPIVFGGKTSKAEIPGRLRIHMEETFYPLEDKFVELFDDTKVCLYGEGYGEKIQKGGKYCSGNKFVLFDIKVGDTWLLRKDVEAIAETLGIPCVPVIGEGTLDDAINMAQKGIKSTWGDFLAEGIVARPKVELKNRAGRRIITKVKHIDFITK